MIKVTKKPEFKKTFAKLERRMKWDPVPLLSKYGNMGVSRLAAATPVDSGDTARGWSFEVKAYGKGYYQLVWKNNQVSSGGAPIVLLIQYGHATRGGTIVTGRDIINPALVPVYDALHDDLVKEALK